MLTTQPRGKIQGPGTDKGLNKKRRRAGVSSLVQSEGRLLQILLVHAAVYADEHILKESRKGIKYQDDQACSVQSMQCGKNKSWQ